MLAVRDYLGGGGGASVTVKISRRTVAGSPRCLEKQTSVLIKQYEVYPRIPEHFYKQRVVMPNIDFYFINIYCSL